MVLGTLVNDHEDFRQGSSTMPFNRPETIDSAVLEGLGRGPGTYVLLFELETPCRLEVGKRGVFDFPSGWYAYTGSALGPGGLTTRLRHHLGRATRPHWHMDYLRPRGRIAEIWYGRGLSFDEHQWAAALQAMAGTPTVASKFGSSDCRCTTHLIHFPMQPNIDRFRRRQVRSAGRRRPSIYRLVISGR